MTEEKTTLFVKTLFVNEIFKSISGEVGLFKQGSIVVFIRLDGCNLTCGYCDTPKTQYGVNHEVLTIDEIVTKVASYKCNRVVITGGEPLLQYAGLEALCRKLKAFGFLIQIETNGSLDPRIIQTAVDCWIVDYKLPSSGSCDKMMLDESFVRLPSHSWIKFVIETVEDFRMALNMYERISKMNDQLNFAMSATNPKASKVLFDWMSKPAFPTNIVLNVQIHKLVGLA